jgi:Fe-S oxidoreductase
MKYVFAPGCALMLYKPYLAEKIHELLNQHFGPMARLDICCRNQPALTDETKVINICPGCDRRFRENYAHASTVSLWELLAENDFFPYPDYQGREMTIIDACPTRNQPRVIQSVRTLLQRMNIRLIEPQANTCCGDSYWGNLPADQVKSKMSARAAEMPARDVVVYCVSCCKSMFIGGKQPHYLVDLLFGEDTLPGTIEPEDWHQELDVYVKGH